MKLIIQSIIVACCCAPLAFADCKKCDGDKEKEETVILAGKCKEKCDGDKEDPALAGKCKEKCDGDKEDPALAGKCK
ncbi:hypothetical protein MLD59_19320, partial [Verrucomicrobiaceae bacterium E54]|nr:hypothetical protein [Verrucomicrobiaceae bacterium E54]